MVKNRIVNGYLAMRDAELEAFATSVIAQVSENEGYFPDPVPAMGAMNDFLVNYRTALAAAQSRDKVDVEDKDQKKELLAGALTQLADYVTLSANNNRLILISSGYKLAKERQPQPPVGNPQNLQLSDGMNAGEMQAKFDRQPVARTYVYQYTQDETLPEKEWEQQTSTQSKLLITGLESGKRYYFRILALGKGDEKAYSDVVSRIVQ